MIIKVKVRPAAGEERIKKLADGSFKMSVKEPPIKGQANRAIILALANYFKVDQTAVRLVAGFSSPHKIFEIKPQT